MRWWFFVAGIVWWLAAIVVVEIVLEVLGMLPNMEGLIKLGKGALVAIAGALTAYASGLGGDNLVNLLAGGALSVLANYLLKLGTGTLQPEPKTK